MAEGGSEERPTSAPSGGPDVFISYASQDAAVAHDIVATLERRDLRCWIAPRDVTPGAHYADSIILAISGAKAFVLVLSDSALVSKHVGKEIERASSKGRPIIALRTGSAPLPPAFEYFLSESQWIDVGAGGLAPVATKLIEAVRSHLDSPIAGEPNAHSGPAVASLGVAAPRKRWMWATVVAGALLTCALAYLAADIMRRSKSAARPQPIAAVPPASSVIPDKSIAVLPFVDMSEKKDQEYFADGMAEEILDLLTKIPGLTVIGRTSSFQFKAKNEDLRTIGTKLDAAYVLEGSVRKAANRVRVTAQLIDTRTGSHQWSETYDRDMGDVLKLQDDIAQAVTQALRLVLTAPLPARPSLKSSEAYRMYLQGIFYSNAGTKVDSDRALSAFRAALALDPQYSPAWAALSFELQNQSDVFGEDARTMYAAAREAAQHAITLDPAAIHGYLAMAGIFISFDWDWARAAEAIETARRLQPGSARVLRTASELATILGHWDEAIGYARQAIARDPLSAGTRDVLAWSLYCKGELAQSERESRASLELAPGGDVTYSTLSRTLMLQGRLPEALAAARKDTDAAYRLWALAMVFHNMGREGESDAALAELKRIQPTGDAGGIAWVYATRGELDSAFAWFEQAYAQRENGLSFLKCIPEAPKFARDPRYKALLRKMNLSD